MRTPLLSIVVLSALAGVQAHSSSYLSNARRSLTHGHEHRRHGAGPLREKRLDLNVGALGLSLSLSLPLGDPTTTSTTVTSTDSSSSTSTDSATTTTDTGTTTATDTGTSTTDPGTSTTDPGTSSTDTSSPTATDSSSDTASATITATATTSDGSLLQNLAQGVTSGVGDITSGLGDAVNTLADNLGITATDSSTPSPTDTSTPSPTDSGTASPTITDGPTTATDIQIQTTDLPLSNLGNVVTSGVGDITSGVGDITSGVGDITSSLGDATSALGDTDTSLPTQTTSLPITTNIGIITSSFPTQTDQPISTDPPISVPASTDTHTASDVQATPTTESVYFPTSIESALINSAAASVTLTDSEGALIVTQTVDTESVLPTLSITTQPIPSEYSYLITASVLPLTSIESVVPTLTITDPDQVLSTGTFTQSGSEAPIQTLALPASLPTRIFPADQLDPNDPKLAGMSLISMKYSQALSWAFVASNTNAAALLFVYTPQMICNALAIDCNSVLPYALQAFAPASYDGNPDDLSTVFLAYIPVTQVDSLQQQLLVKTSPLYTNQAGIPAQISTQIDATFPLDSVSLSTSVVGGGGTTGGSAADSTSPSAESRRNAIIGVCAAFGIILLGVVLWWAYKSFKRQQEKAHRRLTYNSENMHQAGGYGATGYNSAPVAGSYSSDGARSPEPGANPFEGRGSMEVMDERRRSFFYAEDSLRGFSVARGEEDAGGTYNQIVKGQTGQSVRRAPIQVGAISAPILRESSLNW